MNEKNSAKARNKAVEAIERIKNWSKTSRKEKQGKDKRNTKKAVGTMQTNSENQIREYLLHMWKITADWEQLANGSYVGKSKCGCIFEIRPSHTKTTVRYLQSISRGPRCRFLPQDDSRDWPRTNGKVTARQASKRKSNRSLPKPNKPVYFAATKFRGRKTKVKFYLK